MTLGVRFQISADPKSQNPKPGTFTLIWLYPKSCIGVYYVIIMSFTSLIGFERIPCQEMIRCRPAIRLMSHSPGKNFRKDAGNKEPDLIRTR